MFICTLMLMGMLQAVPDESAELQRRLRGGGVVQLEGRVHRLSRPLTISANTTLRGQPGTVLQFSLAPGQYGLILGHGAHNVRIESLVLSGGGIGLYQGERYREIAIIQCLITRPAGTPG
ncbi:MAG TPA: hypothetical protein PKB10_10610, partial [Tepidisphaeraceae bacterium]|nr:hypothetical protein [Tepidisphaeraceae bacterium]